jgi:hypothetical protein
MGRYDSHKHPLQYRLNQWSNKRVNEGLEIQPKSMPCHVVKVDKDFIEVAFETQNGIFTPPTVKIPQSMSQYSREPTQVGDKGYAVPGDYYLGGVTGDAGGRTDFYPRGNLTTLSFQPVSHKANPTRDYDQHTQTGGPNGWIVKTFQKQQDNNQQSQGQSQGGAGQQSINPRAFMRPAAFRHAQMRAQRSLGVQPLDIATTSGTTTSNGSSSQQQDSDQTMFSFDKNKKSTVQSIDTDHSMVVDQQGDHAHLSVTGDGKCYVGGDGNKGVYAKVMTAMGPSKNTFARIG